VAFNAGLAKAIGLAPKEVSLFRRLNTPEKIQDFLTAMPINFEPQGDTCRSARGALKANCCHCIEAAFIAASALLLHGQPALLLDFQASGDDDHIVTLFKRGMHWGAISKSNSIWLRWRDPIYASTRELAMSFFHEYVKADRKTLRRVSKPFDIGKYDPDYWMTSEGDCWSMALEIDASPHVELISKQQVRSLRKRDKFENETGMIKEFTNPMVEEPKLAFFPQIVRSK
jgi:hypothetical protein